MDKFVSRKRKESETAESQPNADEAIHEDNNQVATSNRSQPSRSKVWTFFNRSADKSLVKCISCGKEYKTSGNTSNMADHIKRCNYSSLILNRQSGCTSQVTSERSVESYFNRSIEYDRNSRRKNELDEAITLMIAKDLQPFSIVNDEGFRFIIKKLDPKYVIPSKTIIRNSLMPDIFDNTKHKLKLILDELSYLAVTCDLWSSRATESYLTVTCHFLAKEKLEIKSVVLSTMPLLEKSNHTAQNISSSLNTILTEWNIKNKIMCIVTDNAKVIVKACGLLGIPQLGCLAHSLNLVVQDALKLDEVQLITSKCKDMLKKAQDSTITYKLIQDVQTRWNSTFYMIKRVLKLINPIGRCLLKLKQAPTPLSVEEVLIITEFETILAGFEEVANEICGQSYVTISLIIPMIHGLYLNLLEIKKHLKTEEGLKLCTHITQNLIKRLYPYEQVNVTMIATILDPRFKCEGFIRKENSEKGEKLLANELEEFCDISSENSLSGQSVTSSVQLSVNVLSFLDSKICERQQASNTHTRILQQYINSPIVDRKSNPLEFWKNDTQYEPVRKCAYKYLCIPATSAESERVFSATGQIINERRSKLKAKNVDMLTFLHKNDWLL